MKQITDYLVAYAKSVEGVILNETALDQTTLAIPYRSFQIHYDIMPISSGHMTDQFITRVRVLMKHQDTFTFRIKKRGIGSFNMGRVDFEDEGFDHSYICKSKNPEMCIQVLNSSIRSRLKQYSNMNMVLARQHPMGINCGDDEKGLLLTVPQKMVNQEDINHLITTIKQCIDQLVTHQNISGGNMVSRLI